MITIDTATLHDLEAICALDAIVLGQTARRHFLIQAISAGQNLVAKTVGTVAGFAVMEQSFFGQSFISLVIVHPRYRRNGIGAALMLHCEAICHSEKLFTSANLSNKGMHQLCKKLGYQRSGWIENMDEGDPEIIYFKKLKK